jgi:hypothetical protein
VAFGYRLGEVALPDIPETVKCKIREWVVPPQARPLVAGTLGCHLVGAACPHPDPSDAPTMKAGVQKRFLTKTPTPDPKLLSELKEFVQDWVRANLTPLSADADTTVENWLEKTSYPAWRKVQLYRKFKNLINRRDDKHFVVKSFMKDEVYPEYKHARAINSRTDEFKTMVGPIFKLIEKELFSLDWFIKKIPVKDRPRYIRDRLGHGVEFFASDYTAYEAHFTRDILQAIEWVLYEYMTQYLAEGADFMWYIKEVIGGTNHCVFKFFEVDVEAKRMSGEMNTSLGNGFSNLMLMLFLCKKKKCEGLSGVVEGDDGLFTAEGELPTTKDFEKLGFTIKIEIHERLSDASFCGLVFDPEDEVIVTNPLDELVTFGWTTAKYANSSVRRKKELLRCKAISLAYQYGGCPILTSLARYGLRVTRGSKAKIGQCSEWERDQFLEAKMHANRVIRDVPYKTRFLVERLYGISVENQQRIEAYLDSLETIQPLTVPILDMHLPPSWKHYWEHYVVSGEPNKVFFPLMNIATAPNG